MEEVLLVEKRTSHLLIATLNRPLVKNAINIELMTALKNFWQDLFIKSDDLRCIILTGAGDAFCAGADLKARKNLSLIEWRMQHRVLEQAILAMLDCPIPIIAAVNGAAFGGGLELMMCCDFAYAVEDATFSQSEVKWGLMPGATGTQQLPRTVGLSRAKELAFTGRIFDAKTAHAWGMINQVVSSNQLLDHVIDVAKQIAENAPLAIQQVKKAMNMSGQLDLKSGFWYELTAYDQLLTTKDRAEGIAAFNAKRKPIFTGE